MSLSTLRFEVGCDEAVLLGYLAYAALERRNESWSANPAGDVGGANAREDCVDHALLQTPFSVRDQPIRK
jgi:hypothetical protein